MYPHRIRLRGPWVCEPLARESSDSRPLPPPCRMTMPCHWADGGLADFRGCVRFRRKFGYPGSIDAHERVWLTMGPATGHLRVAVNGVGLGEQVDGGCEYEVTALLRERNELTVEVEGGETSGLWGEVALEVRCTAFLRDVSCAAVVTSDGSAQVRATGELAGAAADALELYVLLDRSTVAYALLPAPVVAQPFCLASEKLLPEQLSSVAGAGEPHRVRVDLVQAAAIWYTWEGELTLEPLPGSQG
jgi:hypothetical protein